MFRILIALISDVKLQKYDFGSFYSLQQDIEWSTSIKQALEKYNNKSNIVAFESCMRLFFVVAKNSNHTTGVSMGNKATTYLVQYGKVRQ